MFHESSLFGRCFRGFVMLCLEYCSAVWCSGADTQLKLLDRAVSGARILTGVCLSVTLHIVDLLQYCIRSGVTPMHPVNGALSAPYVPVRVTLGALVAHRYTYAPPHCRTSHAA